MHVFINQHNFKSVVVNKTLQMHISWGSFGDPPPTLSLATPVTPICKYLHVYATVPPICKYLHVYATVPPICIFYI